MVSSRGESNVIMRKEAEQREKEKKAEQCKKRKNWGNLKMRRIIMEDARSKIGWFQITTKHMADWLKEGFN